MSEGPWLGDDDDSRLKRASVSFARIFAMKDLLIVFDCFSSSSLATLWAGMEDSGVSSFVAVVFCLRRRTRDWLNGGADDLGFSLICSSKGDRCKARGLGTGGIEWWSISWDDPTNNDVPGD